MADSRLLVHSQLIWSLEFRNLLSRHTVLDLNHRLDNIIPEVILGILVAHHRPIHLHQYSVQSFNHTILFRRVWNRCLVCGSLVVVEFLELF